jgi:hypothetical protein
VLGPEVEGLATYDSRACVRYDIEDQRTCSAEMRLIGSHRQSSGQQRDSMGRPPIAAILKLDKSRGAEIEDPPLLRVGEDGGGRGGP